MSAVRGKRPARASLEAEAQDEAALWNKVENSIEDIQRLYAESQTVDVEIKKMVEKGALGSTALISDRNIDEIETMYEQGIANTETMIDAADQTRRLLDSLMGLKEGSKEAGEKADGSSTPAPSDVAKRRKRKGDDLEIQTPARSKRPRVDSIVVGSQVAFKIPKQRGTDTEWIQCVVLRIKGEGPKARYDVQDPEPDEFGKPGLTYTTTVNNLYVIPPDSTNLPTLAPGALVLARYPETTTFYRAEVTGSKRDGTCKLRFEGEEEIGKEMEVERRLVLEVNK